MSFWLTVTRPLVASSLTVDYPTKMSVLRAAVRARQDGMYVQIFDVSGKQLYDSTPEEYRKSLNPEYLNDR